ncbi:hypothetical protein [Ancylomarina sp.]|uniref:hypothetical protein n=1 Tax=Ancylomarina sp. TaxID=1970196 RepID=UPI0035641AE0
MKDEKGFVVAWWSAGVTSAVACKMALEMYDNVKLYYIKIDSACPDNERFKAECEKWYGCKIETLQSSKYKDQFEVIRDVRAVNTPYGAPCTNNLKKKVRFDFEKKHEINLFNNYGILNQVWGFEYSKKEINRAIRFGQQYPNTHPLFPLIEKGLTKPNCAAILMNAGIELPVMYKLGYNNNNCRWCPKGGKGYWNKMRIDFHDGFWKMARLEREVGYSCINGTFLDELKPDEGRMSEEIMPSCGLLCDLEFADMPDKNLSEVLEGIKTIYEAMAA